MEQHPNQGGELQATPISEQDQLIADSRANSHDHPTQTPEHNHLPDDHLIHYHLTEALREDRPIDHATARCIAAQLHGGQTSALYALASSGAVVDGLEAELDTWRRDETPIQVEPWLDALDEYLGSREDPNPIEDWHQLWPTVPAGEAEQSYPGDEETSSEASACTLGQQSVPASIGERPDSHRDELMQRIAAAGVTTLGQVTTIVSFDETAEHSAAEQADDPIPSPGPMPRAGARIAAMTN